jgi:hypothetical protein
VDRFVQLVAELADSASPGVENSEHVALLARYFAAADSDRTSKFAYAELHERQTRTIAVDFLWRLIDVVPYAIHTIFTDNGIQFTHRKTDRYAFRHLFDRVCDQHHIEHRLTKPNHPWTKWSA